MPNGMPINSEHLRSERAVREATLALARLIALQVVTEGSASSLEEKSDNDPEQFCRSRQKI